MQFAALGLHVPHMLIPSGDKVDWQRWAVIACDQFTSEPEYWDRVEQFRKGAPSTLDLVLPECYLGTPAEPARTEQALESMYQYLQDEVLHELPPGFILVERELADGGTRQGLLVALDLEAYDFRPESRSLARATEGTILDRIPPRLQIRRRAHLELPHILVLLDDPENRVIQPLAEREDLQTLYDFELMEGGGRIRGRFVDEPQVLSSIAAALAELADPERQRQRYGLEDECMLYAVGDGNHSLATARAYWEELRDTLSASERDWHPARYALVELVNIHEPCLEFEPIHRVLFNVDPRAFRREIDAQFGARGAVLEPQMDGGSRLPLEAMACGCGQKVMIADAEGADILRWPDAPPGLELDWLQPFVDDFLERQGGSIDYIHGTRTLERLRNKPDTVALVLPAIDKSELFASVATSGPLPRKTFSMGHDCDKRYYLEARRIRTGSI